MADSTANKWLPWQTEVVEQNIEDFTRWLSLKPEFWARLIKFNVLTMTEKDALEEQGANLAEKTFTLLGKLKKKSSGFEALMSALSTSGQNMLHGYLFEATHANVRRKSADPAVFAPAAAVTSEPVACITYSTSPHGSTCLAAREMCICTTAVDVVKDLPIDFYARHPLVTQAMRLHMVRCDNIAFSMMLTGLLDPEEFNDLCAFTNPEMKNQEFIDKYLDRFPGPEDLLNTLGPQSDITKLLKELHAAGPVLAADYQKLKENAALREVCSTAAATPAHNIFGLDMEPSSCGKYYDVSMKVLKDKIPVTKVPVGKLAGIFQLADVLGENNQPTPLSSADAPLSPQLGDGLEGLTQEPVTKKARIEPEDDGEGTE